MKTLILVLSILCSSASAQTADTLDSYPGLHLLADGLSSDRSYRYVSKIPTNEDVENLIDGLEWIKSFHQVILVLSPNVSMEVGGSMNPEDGLSAVYRNKEKGIHWVTEFPPNIEQMKQILILFKSEDESWKKFYGFK